MNKSLLKLVNEQIQAEFGAGYLYLAMAAYCEDQDYPGAAQWFKMQAQEELEHGMKFYKFLSEVDERIELMALDKPKKDFGSYLDLFEASLEHEKKVTSMINKLYEEALKGKVYSLQVFLEWFIKEQVEEENTVREIIAKIKLAGNSKETLFLIDQELAGRKESEH